MRPLTNRGDPGDWSFVPAIAAMRRLRPSSSVIWRLFSRLKDGRRIATRYDRLAINFLAAVALAATVIYWL
jgi:transposase